VRRRSWGEADVARAQHVALPRSRLPDLDPERARFGVSWPGDGDEAEAAAKGEQQVLPRAARRVGRQAVKVVVGQ